ncbi:MAG: hypothetical protein ACE37J_21830 [Pikeienuella sp.]|uniref:hypothetical protein n=1 Tax=Pikeienuella sp. TaxID=2831957 RepID=UPI003919B957
MSVLEMEARAGFFGMRGICRLTQDHVELLRGSHISLIGYGELSSVRVYRPAPGRAALGLVARKGPKITIRLTPFSRSDQEVSAFTAALVERVARAAPMTTLHLGPSRHQWIAAWIGAIVSGAILLAAGWTLAAGGSAAPLLPSVAIAVVNLVVAAPILKSGRPHEGSVGRAAAEGIRHRASRRFGAAPWVGPL